MNYTNKSIELKILNKLIYLAIVFISIFPICAFIFSIKDFEKDQLLFIFLNSHIFVSFYIFCFSLMFNIDPLNKKIILITFLSFLVISLIGLFFNFLSHYVILPPFHSNDFQILLNRSIFFNIIFFIIIMFSYTSFNVFNTDSIADFLTIFGEILLWSAIISIGSGGIGSLISGLLIFTYTVIDSMKYFYLDNLFEQSYTARLIIMKIILLLCIFFESVIPFLAYFIYKKTKSIISVYVSRAFLLLSLFVIFIFGLLSLSEDLTPYKTKISFIVYSLFLAVLIINLMFTRLDMKSSIFTKAVYFAAALFTILFNIFMITVVIYRIANYGLSPNKLTLLIFFMIFLIHLVFISVHTIMSFSIAFKNRVNDSDNSLERVIIDTKHLIFIYVYGAASLIICFVLPLFYIH